MQRPSSLPVHRLPKQTLHHVWSPKLARPLLLASLDRVRLWMMLEADPRVLTYCERPETPACLESLNIDFWANKADHWEWITLNPHTITSPGADTGPICSDIPVRVIDANELDRHQIWIRNWMSLLPYLTSGGRLISPSFGHRVASLFANDAGRAKATAVSLSNRPANEINQSTGKLSLPKIPVKICAAAPATHFIFCQ